MSIGRFWLGELTLDQLVGSSAVVTDAARGGDIAAAHDFMTERSSQLLYPLSFQELIGWDIETHLLVLNTTLGAILVIASYFTALRLHSKPYALLVALLMCSLTPLYWIASYGIVDNVFYAMLPLFALSVVNWCHAKTGRALTFMTLGTGAFVLTRPESIFVVLSVLFVLTWHYLRRYHSPKFLVGVLSISLATVVVGTMVVVSSSSSIRRTVLSRGHISWGLATSANTLFNREGTEFDRMRIRYSDIQIAELLPTDDLSYLMSRDAIAVIKADPLWYLLKIPLRGLALLFPWSYQPWSLPHVLYEGIYTIFLTGGVVLLIRRGGRHMPLQLLLAIPTTIWLFLSVYGIDNDLKHRNGVFVALNLIAPLGYFLVPRSRIVASEGIDRER